MNIAWITHLVERLNRHDRAIAALQQKVQTMSQEITDLQAAQTAAADAAQRAAALIAAMQAKIVTLELQASDAMQIPPITAAMVASTQALDAAIAGVPAL